MRSVVDTDLVVAQMLSKWTPIATRARLGGDGGFPGAIEDDHARMIERTGITALEASASKFVHTGFGRHPIQVRVSSDEIIGRTISMRVTVGISRFGLHRCYYPNCSDERVGWHVAC